MKLTHGLATIVLMSAATAAHAEVTATVTAVSDYDFRGVSLSATDPALQGSIDWSHESGPYLGLWASNIDYGDIEDGVSVDGDLELDLYYGFAGETGGGIGYDVGLVYYMYPSSDDVSDYPEIYAGVSYKFLELKQWYTNKLSGVSDNGFYTEANAGFDLPFNFSVSLHAGYNYGEYFKNLDAEYLDYSIGLGYTLGNFDLEVKYVDNDLDDDSALYTEEDPFNTEGRAIFSVSTTFPWGKE